LLFLQDNHYSTGKQVHPYVRTVKNLSPGFYDKVQGHITCDYRVARNFRGSLICGSANLFCILRELLFAIVINWFFLLSINFRDFQEVAFNLNYNILIIYYTKWNQQVKQHAEM